MKKAALLFSILYIFLTILCACEPVKKPLDNKTGFSKSLKQTEEYIIKEDWQNALSSLESSNKTWKKIKPILQIDIDHDYVNVIENNFVLLKAYIESEEKPDSLAIIRLIQEDWKNIGSM